MSYLFARHEGVWFAYSLDTASSSQEPVLDISRFPPRKSIRQGADLRRGVVFLVPRGGQDPSDGWVLLWGRGAKVRINGITLPTGIRLLRHGDEIDVQGGPTAVFSEEQHPRIDRFAGSDQPTICPRCRGKIEEGHSVVRCPRCRLVFHGDGGEGSDCWRYAPQCLCGFDTNVEEGFKWVPEEW